MFSSNEAEKLWHTFNEITDRMGGLQWKMFVEADKDPEWLGIDKIQPLDNETDKLKWVILSLKRRLQWIRKWQAKHALELLEVNLDNE